MKTKYPDYIIESSKQVLLRELDNAKYVQYCCKLILKKYKNIISEEDYKIFQHMIKFLPSQNTCSLFFDKKQFIKHIDDFMDFAVKLED